MTYCFGLYWVIVSSSIIAGFTGFTAITKQITIIMIIIIGLSH